MFYYLYAKFQPISISICVSILEILQNFTKIRPHSATVTSNCCDLKSHSLKLQTCPNFWWHQFSHWSHLVTVGPDSELVYHIIVLPILYNPLWLEINHINHPRLFIHLSLLRENTRTRLSLLLQLQQSERSQI